MSRRSRSARLARVAADVTLIGPSPSPSPAPGGSQPAPFAALRPPCRQQQTLTTQSNQNMYQASDGKWYPVQHVSGRTNRARVTLY